MRTTRKLFAWVLLFSIALSFIPPVTAAAAGGPVVINAMDYGADPTGATDSTDAVWAALQAARELEKDGSAVILEFPKGEYHIYKDHAQTREYHTSNTNSIENPIKTIGILIEEHENLTLDGNGSLFMMHGNMMALAVVKSENITLKDFAWDFAVPTVSELTVTSTGPNYTEFYIPSCFPYSISGNTLVWSSELSPYTGQPYWTATGNHNTYAIIAYHPDDEMARNFGTDISPFTNATGITEVGSNVIRITYSHKNSTQTEHHKPGTVFALCGNAHRETAGAFTWESKNVVTEGVNVHFMHGFGWLIQMSEDITYRNCNLMPRKNSGHMTVSFADGLHASGAAGEILVENCNFSNTHDDPINFHGTFTRVEQRIDDNTLKLKYVHTQQGGFPQFHPGDQVAFFTRDTLESSDNETLYEVAEVVSEPGEDGNDLRTMVVRFKTTLPAYLTATVSNGTPRYVAENVTYAPAVTIRQCTFKNVPTRGILCTTRNPLLIEDNIFMNMSMATIFLSNDSNDWYESGPIRDMTIRNNTFYIKTIGDTYWDYKSAIYIHPVTYGGGLPSADNPIHKNITIEGNTFHMSDDTVVKAESVENLTIRNNTILRTDPEFEITLSAGSGNLAVGETVTLTTTADGTTIIGDNNKNLSDTTSRNYDNVFEFTACKNVIIAGNTYDDGMKNYAVISNMPQSYLTNKDEKITPVSSASLPADDPVSDLVYVSSDPNVVSVDANGQVTAMGTGSAHVYAYYVWNGTVVKSNSVTFTVAAGSGSAEEVVIQQEGTIVLNDTASSATLTANANATWMAADFLTGGETDVVTVAADGTVTAARNGIAWVKAIANGSEDKIAVVVSLSRMSALNKDFSITREDAANYSIPDSDASKVTVALQPGDVYGGYYDNLKNLFLYDQFVRDDVRTIIKVEGLPARESGQWDTASFFLYQSDDNYISLGKKSHFDGFAAVSETNDSGTEYAGQSTHNDVTTAYLGFTNTGNGTVTLDYSLDGVAWAQAHALDGAMLGSDYRIGFSAWETNARGKQVTFSEFRVGRASQVSYTQLMAQDAIPFLRTENMAPTVTGVTFDAASYSVGDKVAVSYSFCDPDGDPEGASLYLWTYEDEGAVKSTVTAVPEFTVVATGTLTCAVYPVDDLGAPGAPAEASVVAAAGDGDLSLSSLCVNGVELLTEDTGNDFEILIPADLTKVEMRYRSLMTEVGTTTVAAGSAEGHVRANFDRFSLDVTEDDTITITRSAPDRSSLVYTVKLVRVESNATDIQGFEIPELAFGVSDLADGTWLTKSTEPSATLKVLADDTVGCVEVRYNNYRVPVAMTKTETGYEGRIDFITGLNSYYITVIAKDGITTERYNINVVYTPDTTSVIRNLKINGISLENFASDQYGYLLELRQTDTLNVEVSSGQRVRIRIDDTYIMEDSSKTSLSVSGLAEGSHDVYVVSVADDGIVKNAYRVNVVIPHEEYVTLTVGESVSFTDDSGYYVGADTSALDSDVATANITGTVTATARTLSQLVTELESSRQYIIVNTRANKPVTNAPAAAAAAAGAGSGLSLAGSKEAIEDAAIWTITGADGIYTVRAADGKYMTVGSNSAGVSTTEARLNLNYKGGTWTIAQNGAYLNHFGGGSNTCAAGWQDSGAAGDSGSQWAIYEVLEVPTDGTTRLTFTGVTAGKTSVRVGNTVYFVTVNEAPHPHVYDQKDTAGAYLATPATCDKAATYYLSCECGEKGTETFPDGDSLGHSFTEYKSNNDAACTENGTETAKCDRCDEIDVRIVADSALGHTPAEAVRENGKVATCTEPGSYDEVVYCSVCDEVISRKTVTVKALGHKNGNNDHKCDVCGETLSECVDENKDYKCDICGKDLEKSEDPEQPTEPKKDEVIRLAGANRFETALKVADEMKTNLRLEKFDAIIIASGNDFADALAGSYLSTVKNAPILLGWGRGGKYVTLDEANIAYIKANLAEDGILYILGGTNAVPELYENELKGYTVKRLGGANRFETNLLILAEAGVKDGSEILVCTATNFADSLSASATAKPILLVFNEYGKLYGRQPEYMAGLKNCSFTVIGGKSAVSAKLADEIARYGKVTRLAGANRFETSVMVAEKYFENVDTAVLAYAWNYPDGLCGGSLAYSMKAPLILTMNKYETQAIAYAKDAGITTGLVLGGDTLISDDAVRAIFTMDAADDIIVK